MEDNSHTSNKTQSGRPRKTSDKQRTAKLNHKPALKIYNIIFLQIVTLSLINYWAQLAEGDPVWESNVKEAFSVQMPQTQLLDVC